MTAIRYEVWTRPESASFELKFPLREVVDSSFTMEMFGNATIEIPLTLDRIDDIIFIDQSDRSNDEASMIRAFVGEASLYDFYVEKMELNFTDLGQRTATIFGEARGTALDRVRMRQFDWPASPSIQPDWSWGLDSIVSPNAGMEESPDSLQNPGAEDGTTEGWIAGLTGGLQPDSHEPDQFLVDQVDPASGTWGFVVTADLGAGVYQEIPVVGGSWEVPDEADVDGKIYTITAEIAAASGDIVDMVLTNAHSASTGTFINGTAFVQIVGNDAYQTATVVFEAQDSGASEIRFVSQDTGGPITFRFDDVTAEGYGIGVDDWEPFGDITVFQASAIIARTGTYSLAWFPNSGILGNDKPGLDINTTPGQEITASFWVYHTEAAAKDFRLVLVIPGVDPNVSNVASVPKSVPSVTWTQIVGTGTAVTSVTRLEVRYDETGVPVSNLHVDDAEVTVGQPPRLLGKILNDVFDDAATDHSGDNRTALAWLTRTWTDTLDSAGNAWDEELNVTIRRGITYREVVEIFERMGYQFSFDVNPADASDIRMNAYNPDGMGTDHSTGDGPAILSRPGILSAGPFARREPFATYFMVEGENFEWNEYRDTTLETAWGEIEGYIGDQDLPSGVLLKTATEQVTADVSESIIVSFAGHTLTPGIDYVEGDTIRLTLGDIYLPSETFKVAAISVQDSEIEPHYQVEFQPV